MSPPPEDAKDGPLVGLFVTCLVDLFRPSVAFAAIKLLEAGGVRVEVPRTQTCCGQPAYNSGNGEDAAAIARQGLGRGGGIGKIREFWDFGPLGSLPFPY